MLNYFVLKVKGAGVAVLNRLNPQSGGESRNESSTPLTNKGTINSKSTELTLKSSNSASIKGFEKPSMKSPNQDTRQTAETNSINYSDRGGVKQFKKPPLSVPRPEDTETSIPKSTNKKPLPKINLHKSPSKHNSKRKDEVKVSEKSIESGNKTTKKSETSLFDEVVDNFLVEYEDWTSEHLYKKFSASFDYSLNFEDFSSKVSLQFHLGVVLMIALF